MKKHANRTVFVKNRASKVARKVHPPFPLVKYEPARLPPLSGSFAEVMPPGAQHSWWASRAETEKYTRGARLYIFISILGGLFGL